jgi:glycosyltransferase involved in cell wall biosynthesis
MKIAVDARELTGKPTGVGRYLAELMSAWAGDAESRRHEWLVYSPVTPDVPEAFRSSIRQVTGGGGTQWEQWDLARALSNDRPDVLFAPGYTAPFTAPCPTAVTIHDVSFAAHPEWFSWREGARRRTLTAWSARRARLVLTDSAFSRGEIARHLGIPHERIRVVLLGMSRPRAMRNDSDGAVHQVPDASGRLILFVGSIFRRRHVDRLIAAFCESIAARLPDSRLEIVGENRSHPPIDLDRVLRHYPAEIAARVSLRSYVDDATLDALYARASVFAFPSEYEGFGLTPLEALARGVPPVVLDTPIAREIYDGAARYVSADLRTVAPLADAIVELVTSPTARQAVLAHAPAVLARYDWNRAARETLRAIEEAGGV